MEKNKVEEPRKNVKVEAEKEEEKLPYCTTAASPEQARANNEDEPCDDGRSGDTEK